MSGFILYHNGPLHWMSKRQKFTACSSTEAEIYATDEYVTNILWIMHIITDMDVEDIYMSGSLVKIYNNNNACVCWSKSTATKGLRHITIRDNATCELVQNNTVSIQHIAGKVNLADIFTKEFKDITHCLSMRDIVTCIAPSNSYSFL